MIDDTLISDPAPDALSSSNASRAIRTTPSRFTSRIFTQSASDEVAKIAAHVEAGIVHDDIRAPERTLDFAEQRRHVLPARDVHGHRGRL